MQDVCVVVPTIREFECVRDYVANARAHGFDTDRLHVVLVTEDHCPTAEMREMLRDLDVSGAVFDGRARSAWLADHDVAGYEHLIPARSHAQTSFGLLYLWAEGFDYGVFLDDDTRPHEGWDFFGRHLANLGPTAGLGLRRYGGRFRGALVGLALLPLLVPGVVIGVSLLTFFSVFGLQQSYLALVLAHSLWATPLTFSVMQSSFARFDWRRHEAARDLGASRLVAFRAVVVPEVRTGLVVAALVAFIVSLQEFVMALFLSGPDTRTVPVQAWNSLRQSLDPLVSVVSTILLAAVVLLVLVGTALAGIERLATDA